MAYTKQNYQPGDVLTAEQMNKMQDVIIKNEGNIDAHIESKNNPHGVTIAQIGAAPALQYHAANLTAVGWYKVGTIQTTDHTAHATIYTGGIYSTKSPTSGIVDISFSYYRADAKTRLQCNVGQQIMRVGVVQESERVYGVYVYYNCSTRNVVQIYIDTVDATFTPIDFEAVSIAESDMKTVAYLDEYDNPPMELGVEYRTTERHNGKVVYAQAVYLGVPAEGTTTVSIPTGKPIRHTAQQNNGYDLPYGSESSSLYCRVDIANYTAKIVCGSQFFNTAGITIQVWYTKD